MRIIVLYKKKRKNLTSIRWIMNDIRPDMGKREQYMKNRAVQVYERTSEVGRGKLRGPPTRNHHHDMASAACNSLSSASSASSAVGWRTSTRLAPAAAGA